MSTAAPPAASPTQTVGAFQHRISTLISRLHFKVHIRKPSIERNSNKKSANEYQDQRPPLLPSSALPLVLPQHQHLLAQQGWTTITLPSPSPSISSNPTENVAPPPPTPHPLHKATNSLFLSSQTFFSLPPSQKALFKTPHGSEEGWSHIPGEKEFITIRTLDRTPECLKESVREFWGVAGELMERYLGRIEEGLGMEEGNLVRFVGPCSRVPGEGEQETATMLRLFRYEGSGEKVVAEPHADLGLLSLVLGQTPGLEIWTNNPPPSSNYPPPQNPSPSGWWHPIEKTYASPSATLLSGRQLEALTNNYYPPGGHRVVSYSSSPNSSAPSHFPLPPEQNSSAPKYRYSIVLVLRAHSPVLIDTDNLTTSITGEFEWKMRGLPAGELFEGIRRKHFNVNTGLKEREEQRRRIALEKERERGREKVEKEGR